MKNLMLVGTAASRPDAIGTIFTLRPGGEWETADGIPADASVQAITPHPERENLIFAATRKGVYRSMNSGQSWQRLNVTDENAQFWCVVTSPHNPDTLFAGTAPVGFYRSDDGGDTWKKCKADYPERFKISFGASRVMRIAFHPTDPSVLYAVSEINGFLLSDDGGETWHGRNDGLVALSQQPHLKSKIETDDDAEGMFDAHSVVTTPADPDALFYICRLGIFESRNKGNTFRDIKVGKFAPFAYTRDCRFVAGSPKKMYACFSISSRSNAGALYGSDDLGKTWYRADSQVDPQSTMLGFGVHATDPNGIVTVTRGGQVFYTLDGGQSWTEKRLPQQAGDAFSGAIL
ncbi:MULTISPECIES: VPS10 domain-containing protein [unclassified Caballeronia]|uniref:WD40/YVTN/BNR-like repeat-containing protein n=1 Tax=unclassified Caballeronia TaxID=2646786 RepID=UPI002861DF74|nr:MULTISPECIES: hypothetical protein [unclassified Caballeronia]MDR5752467.1 hypothetical protein [Caballeronia sp. LZ024]MDR5845273.1 hypothetical protein [Caballeronia sp. LZ031]